MPDLQGLCMFLGYCVAKSFHTSVCDLFWSITRHMHSLIIQGHASMPLILQFPIYTMLPSKDNIDVHAPQAGREEDLNADEAPRPPRYRPWNHQT
jgi:hypothetical protein